MLSVDPQLNPQLNPQLLPSTEELPCSDDTPVDNEDQNLLPNLLLFALASLWADRQDWYFGVDMAVYHTTGENPRIPVVPDGFLSLNVERKKGGKSRRSYALWEENWVVPTLVLEMVSHKPGGDYGAQMALYGRLGVLYYAISNPEFWRRDRHRPLEVYKLIQGQYALQGGEPYWMPEVGLGLGRHQQTLWGIDQELLAWFDDQGQPQVLPEVTRQQWLWERQRADTAQSQAQQERQRADTAQSQAQQERQRADRLADYIRSLGLDPNQLP